VYGSRVYVATENDTVYALDSSTGAIVWQRHLATPVDAVQLCGGDIDPTVGITSTPAIDPSTGRIYVVADTWDGSNFSSIAHEMYALNLSDGSVAVGPVGVDPPGSTHGDQLQRTSLALDAGKVIIGYGGNDSDCGNYHGWLVAVPEGGGSLQTFEVDPSTSQGAIWASGNAPAIDASGKIWISTGNGSSGTFGYQESVIKLDPTNLDVLDFWAPSNWSYLDQNDIDLGSTMPLLLPGALVFEIGKQGVGYLLSASGLGGKNAAPVYSRNVCNGSWGGGIYDNGVIYVSCSDGMYALKLDTTAKTFAPLAGWNVNSNAVAPPIFAGGLVWSVGSSVSVDNGVLYALNPSTGATRFSADLNGFEHFATPSAAGGLLFIANDSGSGDYQVTAFRIANPPPSSGSPGSGSGSSPSITGSPPNISQLHVRVVRRRLRLRLALSEPATLTIAVRRLVPGRIVHRVCRAAAKRGRRCQAMVRKLKHHRFAAKGVDALRLRMRPLPPGRYLVVVTAANSSGRSRRHFARVTVTKPQRKQRHAADANIAASFPQVVLRFIEE
jgi:outer membrane protein assembly factor BamB